MIISGSPTEIGASNEIPLKIINFELMGKLKIFLPECVNASKYPAYYSSKTLFNRNLIGKLLFSALLFFFILNGLHGKCNCPDKNIIRTPDFSCHDETEAFPEIFPEAIYNPVKICNAPANESTIIATSAGQYKIFLVHPTNA